MTPIFAQTQPRARHQVLRLRQQAQTDKAPRVAQRLQAILLSLDGYTAPAIAELLQVHRTRVHAWVCHWNEQGLEGIKEGHRSGRPCELTPAQCQQLHDIIESGPVAYGLNTGVWTSPLLTDLIHEEFAVQYHPGHVRKLLHRIGLSVQRPTTRLVQADPKEQRKGTRYTYPTLKKTPARKAR